MKLLRYTLLTFATCTVLFSPVYGQKHINLTDCRTLGRIMGSAEIRNFLDNTVDCKEPVLMFTGMLPHSPQPINTKCRAVDVGETSYRIIDSAELKSHYYAPCRVVRVLTIRDEKQGVVISLDWMERSAVFDISESGGNYRVRLTKISELE